MLPSFKDQIKVAEKATAENSSTAHHIAIYIGKQCLVVRINPPASGTIPHLRVKFLEYLAAASYALEQHFKTSRINGPLYLTFRKTCHYSLNFDILFLNTHTRSK